MFRRALAVLVSAAFLGASAPVPPAPAARAHACCETAPKKAPVGDSHACCRPALPAAEVRAAAASCAPAISAHAAPSPVLAARCFAPAAYAPSSPRDGAPSSLSGLSPPRA